MSNTDVDGLFEINMIIIPTTLAITLILQSAFFVRFRCKTDKASLGILVVYLIVNIVRMTS